MSGIPTTIADIGDTVEYLVPKRFGTSLDGPVVRGSATVEAVASDGSLMLRVPFDYGAHPLPGLEGRAGFEVVNVRHWDDPANGHDRMFAVSWRWPVT